MEDAQRSSLAERDLLTQARPADWGAALRLLAAALPDDQPSIVVFDEVPYLMGRDDACEGVLQRSWDRLLERKPVLLLLIGSDLSMMEALTAYDRPFHQRGREIVIGPLNPREIGQMLGLNAADAFDAALVTGGLPLICAEWSHGVSRAHAGPHGAGRDRERGAQLHQHRERRRGDTTAERVATGWATWRGRAIEPLVREALARLLPDQSLPAAPAVGGFCTRNNRIEIDIVGADRGPVAKRLLFVGSIKWLNSPFDEHDRAALLRHWATLTDQALPLVAASRSGVRCANIDAASGPDDLIRAWP